MADQPRYQLVPMSPTDAPDRWAQTSLPDANAYEMFWRAGFDAGAADDWYQTAVEVFAYCGREPVAREVAEFSQVAKVAGFDSAGLVEWASLLQCNDPAAMIEEARRWLAAGFTHETAGYWLGSSDGFDPQPLELAVVLANHGWYPYHPTPLYRLSTRLDIPDLDAYKRAWVESGIDANTALDFVRAGVEPEEAVWLNAQPDRDELYALLSAREDLLPPLDPQGLCEVRR